MRKATQSFVMVSLAVLFVLAGCGDGASGKAATATRLPGGSASVSPGKTVSGPMLTKTAAPSAGPGGVSPAQGGTLKEALTAKEAFAVADPVAKTADASYRLFEVWGCTANSTDYAKDEHIVNGGCVTWVFRYTRPMKPGSYEGYHELLLWVGPNGILKREETLKDKAAAVVAKGAVADWKLDSTEAVEIAEREGGKEYRQQNPRWDPGLFQSDKNAVLTAHLEFVPYFDVTYTGGKEVPGAKSVVWTLKYPPAGRYVYVIDAYNGALLLKGDAKKP